VGVKVGVIAIQGDVAEHIAAFRRALFLGDTAGTVHRVRSPGDLRGCDAIAIPGGESTTIQRMIERIGLRAPIENFPGGIFATCAGMVLVARRIEDDPRIQPLGLMDITVRRNAFGRQRESFEADLTIHGIDSPYHAIFIRAPVITASGPGVQALCAMADRRIVAVREGRHMALAFHPELTPDPRLHLLFLKGLV
jgi:5'-phosphate synthase pdxT subunit